MMRLRNVLLITLALVLTYTTQADIKEDSRQTKREVLLNKIKSMNREDFINAFTNSHKRVPNTIDPSKLKTIANSKRADIFNPVVQNAEAVQTLPENIVFPGEFDEVKAILITWPYVSVDEKGSPTEQMFENLVFYYDQVNDNMYSETVTNYVDTFPESPYPTVFAQLAHAIDNEAEVWINVWAAEDSNVVKDYMASHSMPLQHSRFFVNPGNSFWYRDCGPVAFYYGTEDSVGFIDFEYYGGRPLDDKIPVEIAKVMGYPVFTTSIEYEGGNILMDGKGSLFTTEALYSTNQDTYGLYFLDSDGTLNMQTKDPLTVGQIQDSLRYLLNLKNIKVYPSLQYDGGTGHIDLYADMTDENTFVFSQYPDAMKNFTDYSIASRNIDSIMAISRTDGTNYKKRYIPFPRKDNGNWYLNNKDYAKYTRTYSNHVFVNNTIIQPVFSNDTTASYQYLLSDLDSIKANYPGYNIVPIDVRSFDGSGGAIHCITKQIPASNPIKHTRIPEMTDSKTSYSITAEVNNKSGIASVICRYKNSDSQEWQEITMPALPNINQYGAEIPNNLAEGSIDYYIQAVSNNGKTTTKPFAAPENHYTFTFPVTSTDVEDGSINSSIIESGEFYPNPARESASIRINSENGNHLAIVITDMLGNRLYENSVALGSGEDIVTINTGLLSSGSYLVTLKSGNSISHKMLIVTK